MDSETYDVIEKKNQQLITTVASMISGYTASMTTLVTMENQNIKKVINDLITTVKEQNGSIKSLKEWKAEVEGEERGEAKIEERQEIASNLKATEKRSLAEVLPCYYGTPDSNRYLCGYNYRDIKP